MSRISLKTDYEDGKVLQASELNVNNNVTMLGVNDNFNRINNLSLTKADTVYVDNQLASKVDLSTLTTQINALNLTKADKSALATKADQTEVDLKANQSYVDSELANKANQSYVDTQLNGKVDVDSYREEMSLKANNTTVGDLRYLKTEDKTSIVNAINSINLDAKAIATVDEVGVVKPDGTTITIDQDGTIHSVGGGGGTGGTTDYDALSNKPKINGVEVKGDMSLDTLGLKSAIEIEDALDEKADINNVYTKNYIDTNVIGVLSDKADTSYVNSSLQGKANTVDVYNKTAVDALIETTNETTDSKLLLKADKEDVYNKTYVDSKVSAKADNLSFEDDLLQLTSNGQKIGQPVKVEVSGNEVVIANQQPEDDNWKIWISSNEVQNLGSEVINSLAGDEPNLAPSVKAVNSRFKYSSDEVVVGEWFGKPLYRKVINFGSLPNNTEKTITTDIPNTYDIQNIYGRSTNSSKSLLTIPYCSTTITNQVALNVGVVSGKYTIGISTGRDRSDYSNTYIVVEYTKTTD